MKIPLALFSATYLFISVIGSSSASSESAANDSIYSPPWWNPRWKHRVPVYIDGAGGSFRDVQVRLDIDRDKAPSLDWELELNDIRFVYFDPEYQAYADIDFWIFDERITHGAWFACCSGNLFNQYHSPAATYYTTIRPNAIRFVGSHDRTYFVYGDFSRDPAIRYYDHYTKELSDAQIIGRTQIPYDAHGNPSLLIDDDGYLYVFYGCHHDPIQMRRSLYPEEIEQWSGEKPIPALATYPQPCNLDDATIILTYRDKPPDIYETAYLSYILSLDGGDTWSAKTDIIAEEGIYPYVITETGNESPDRSVHFAVTPFDYQTRIYTGIYYAYSDDRLKTFKHRDGTDIEPPPFSISQLEPVFEGNGSSSHIVDMILDEDNDPYILFVTGPWTQTSTIGEGEYRIARFANGDWETRHIAPCDHLFDRGCLTIEPDHVLKAYIPVDQINQDGGEIAEFTSYDGGSTWSGAGMITHSSRYSHNYAVRVRNHHPELKVLWSYGDSSPTRSADSENPSEVYLYGDRGIINSQHDEQTNAYVRIPELKDGGDLYMYYGYSLARTNSSFVRTMRTSYSHLPSGEPDENLIVEWLMETQNEDLVTDSSIHGNDGIIYSAGEIFAFGGSSYERRYDVLFPGTIADLATGDYIESGELVGAASTDQLTVELWFRPGYPEYETQPLANIWGGHDCFYLNIVNGYIQFYTSADYVSGGEFYTQHIAEDKWHHIVATYNGEHMELYLDGVKSSTRMEQQGALGIDGGRIRLGLFENRYYRGMIDEFRIYSTTLSREEVICHFEKRSCAELSSSWGAEETFASDWRPALAFGSYPNPSNRVTTVFYNVARRDLVSIDIYSVSGQLVRTLLRREAKDSGEYCIPWDGRNNSGIRVESGIYFCRLTVGASRMTTKIVLLK